MIKNKKVQILNLILCVLLMSCSTSKVIVDFDDNVNFSTFNSFEFYEDNGENLNEFDVKRITTAIVKELKLQGLYAKESPDFYIYFDAVITENQNNNTIGIGLGNGGRNGGFGISGGIPIGGKKMNEKIIIKFIEASSNDLIWEGFLTSTIKEKRDPQQRSAYISSVIQKIIEKYPPKKSSKN